MLFLGVDPGVQLTGVAIIDVAGTKQTLVEYGVIRTNTGVLIEQRLRQLHDDLATMVGRHEGIVAAGVEELFFAKNVKTALNVAQARGVILFTLTSLGVTIHHVKPVEVKAALTGSGNADKQEVQRMVQLQFGLESPPQPDDAADAIAIALTAAAIHKHQRT